MDETDISAVSDQAQSAAGAKFDAEIKKGSSIEDAATTAVSVGAAVGATAACAATGVGAAVAPLCGAVGAWLGPKIVSVGKAIGKFFSNLFGPSEAYKKHVHDIRINEQDVKPDPNHVGTLYAQLGLIDYLLMRQLSDTVTVLGQAVQDFDMVPDGDHILTSLSKSLKLVFLSNDPHTASTGWTWIDAVPGQESDYPAWKWDGNYRAPSYTDAATAILKQWGSGAITNKTAADAVQGLVDQSKAWSNALATEAARYLVLLATDITVREGLTTSAGRYAPHLSDPTAHQLSEVKAAVAAGRYSSSYLLGFGIVDGVQFIRRA